MLIVQVFELVYVIVLFSLSSDGMVIQNSLLDMQSIAMRNVDWGVAKANFIDMGNSTYEVTVEVSSQKFLVNVVRSLDDILAFEIIAVKGFMEITIKVIECLKKLVQHLREMLD
ncbi:hypothetical protein AGMMS50249_0700 [candidate division SR1 bacterium]|nr:hypothetical protein AGMMS50249_0700 [candidate division SR1 bacterium]